MGPLEVTPTYCIVLPADHKLACPAVLVLQMHASTKGINTCGNILLVHTSSDWYGMRHVKCCLQAKSTDQWTISQCNACMLSLEGAGALMNLEHRTDSEEEAGIWQGSATWDPDSCSPEPATDAASTTSLAAINAQFDMVGSSQSGMPLRLCANTQLHVQKMSR